MRSALKYLFAVVLVSVFKSPVVDLGYAKYRGSIIQDPVNGQPRSVFLGVRYAASPTGELRFSAPEPPPVVPGIIAATSEPPMCWQGVMTVAGFSIPPSDPTRAASSEDCLFLNVYVPGKMFQNNLPVVVWFHGGAYVLGNGRSSDGSDLIRKSGEKVIAVIVQYRLGLFGFLAGQDMKTHGALNAGLLDQQLALRWVQENIAKFGGDPSRVTIWGESAGGGSVLQHVIANDGKTTPPLFRGAIASSLYLPSQYPYNHAVPERIYSTVVERAGCSSSENTFKCLQSTDISTLEAINVNLTRTSRWGDLTPLPVVDGTFITKRPTQLLREGHLNTRVALGVTNSFEGNLFLDNISAQNLTRLAQAMYPGLTDQNARTVASMYAGHETPRAGADAILSDSMFLCPTYSFLRGVGERSFKAEFAVPPAYHAMDVAYYFPNGALLGIPAIVKPDFISAFSGMFLDFVISQDPNEKVNASSILPPWPEWNGSNEMLFNTTASGDADIRLFSSSGQLLERCRFWDSVTDQTSQ